MMEIKATNQQFVDLVQGLYDVQDIPDLNFAKKVLYNTDVLEGALKPLEDVGKPSKEFEEFAQKVRGLGGDPGKIKELEADVKEVDKLRHTEIAALKNQIEFYKEQFTLIDKKNKELNTQLIGLATIQAQNTEKVTINNNDN